MQENQLQLDKERSFGDLFNATFSFIKNEFAALGKSILYFAVAPLTVVSIISSITAHIQQSRLGDLQNNLSANSYSNPFEVYQQAFSPLVFVNYILMFLTSTLLATTVLSYLKLYHENGSGNFKTIDVWHQITKVYGKILGSSFLVSILTIVGFVLCILPGIYLTVVLCAILPIIVFEGIGFSNAFNRSILLIKKDFWSTFGTLIVIGIICYLIVLIFSIPGILVGLQSLIFLPKENATTINFNFTYYLINSIVYILQQIIFTIPLILITLIYFSQLEKNEKPSLEQRINQISENE